jgi:shikimate dehydrogenase
MTFLLKNMHNSHFAVIGNPVKHSRSPSIHQLFALQTGVGLVYDRLLAPVDQFEPTVHEFFTQGGAGLNVTVPFKQQAWELARAHLTPRAKMAQAVNTLWMKNNVLHGCNTDGVGLVTDLERLGVQFKQARILLIGAGGASRGVLGPILGTNCAHLRIVNRTELRATELVRNWQQTYPDTSERLSAGGLADAKHKDGWDVVINASSSSLGDTALQLPEGLYAPGSLAYDMMYGAQPTSFMLQAIADGAKHTSDGLGMLVAQAAESFYIWHGIKPDIRAVLTAIRAELDASIT